MIRIVISSFQHFCENVLNIFFMSQGLYMKNEKQSDIKERKIHDKYKYVADICEKIVRK